jgi:beta-lactam-binding protein with PASTA domain
VFAVSERPPKRVPSFTVTAAGKEVNLDDSGAARAPFTVTNISQEALKGRLLTKPDPAAKPEWFSVVGESLRDFPPNTAEQVVVQVKVPPPPGSEPGSYSFRLDAVSEKEPDEDFTEGQSVSFKVVAPPEKPSPKFPWWILILVGAVVLLIVIGVVVWLLVRDTGPKTASVPAVIGFSSAVAQSTLTNAGFTMKSQAVPVSNPAQNGVVQTQDPAAGTVQPTGTDVKVTVGHMSLVPAVRGLTEDKAKNALHIAGLRAAVRDVGSDPAQNGIVVSQDPAAGTLQAPGTVVTIAVGRNVVVPGVIRLRQEQAVAALSNVGLRAGVIRVNVFNPAQNGIVLSQTPAPGSRLPLGSFVTIHVGFFVAIG